MIPGTEFPEILVSPIITSFPKFSSTIILTALIPTHTSTQTHFLFLSPNSDLSYSISLPNSCLSSIIMPYILKGLEHAMIERMASRQNKHEFESHH